MKTSALLSIALSFYISSVLAQGNVADTIVANAAAGMLLQVGPEIKKPP
jgi:hypothetical protein